MGRNTISSSGVCQFWKKQNNGLHHQPYHDHHGDSNFQNIQNGGHGRRESIDQNSLLFLFYRALYLSFSYYELGSTLRTGSNHSYSIVLRLSRT